MADSTGSVPAETHPADKPRIKPIGGGLVLVLMLLLTVPAFMPNIVQFLPTGWLVRAAANSGDRGKSEFEERLAPIFAPFSASGPKQTSANLLIHLDELKQSEKLTEAALTRIGQEIATNKALIASANARMDSLREKLDQRAEKMRSTTGSTTASKASTPLEADPEFNSIMNQLGSTKDSYMEADANLGKQNKDKEKLEEHAAQIGRLITNTKIAKQYIDELFTDVSHAYFAIRAMALGALGALITHIVKTSILSRRPQGEALVISTDLVPTLVVGALVAAVAFGLFFTKTLSLIAPKPEDFERMPDFWRITMLCVLAGAFADRLYELIAERMRNLETAAGLRRQAEAQATPDAADTSQRQRRKKDAKGLTGMERPQPQGENVVPIGQPSGVTAS